MPSKAKPSEKSDDEKLLVAVVSLWDSLPPVDNHKLGALLGIKPGTAAVRWHRLKAKLFKDSENNKAGDDVEVEHETVALGNPTGEKRSAENADIEQAVAVFDNRKRGKTGGRKRAAATKGPNEPPAQRKKFDKSIGISLNASTSKLGPGKGRKTNEDKEPLEGLCVFKQENFLCPNKNPRPVTMSTESAEDQRLIAAVFKQIKFAEIILDYEQLAKDLKIKAMHPGKAAGKRWIRYKQRHGLVAERSAKNEVIDEMENCMNVTPKAGNGKKTGKAAKGTNEGKKAASKKRKIVKDEDDNEEEDDDFD
ncbi:uncharacterized protein Bfra_006352 [Botrytis fragariae]|uniref:Uncharacterized protein n=1 Tax=Botrytis fragariae TaxID=1964551 RepID=A0A8H6B4R8_9HELO|nr:uncharacterized protein Bfra_006352 [Botrytis fragariae]KAF5879148.1 hypothetical protein Bfra_006352 [Botrytis fragariae]